VTARETGDTATTKPASRARRMLEGLAFVAGWIAIGYVFDLGSTFNRQCIYLLIGIPITIVFQLVIRKRPLRELWVRNGPRISVRSILAPVAVVLMVVPVYLLARDLVDTNGAGFVGYDLVLFVGAIGGGYAARQFTDATWADLAKCFLTAGLIGILTAINAYAHTTTAHPFGSPFDAPASRDFFVSLGTYLPAMFVIEEVWFRGAVDSHVHHDGERHGILSAIFVSLLWSWWHLPITVGEPVIESVFVLPTVMVPMGIFLSIFWRRSGNLAVPGFSHAFSDSVRNILIGVP
jgi:membrane protease YdiL (CAAX protease family)